MGKITDVDIVQRSIVLELLRNDHDSIWTFGELCEQVYDVPQGIMRQAIAKLAAADVVETSGSKHATAWATAAPRYLDALGMVCI